MHLLSLNFYILLNIKLTKKKNENQGLFITYSLSL